MKFLQQININLIVKKYYQNCTKESTWKAVRKPVCKKAAEPPREFRFKTELQPCGFALYAYMPALWQHCGSTVTALWQHCASTVAVRLRASILQKPYVHSNNAVLMQYQFEAVISNLPRNPFCLIAFEPPRELQIKTSLATCHFAAEHSATVPINFLVLKGKNTNCSRFLCYLTIVN